MCNNCESMKQCTFIVTQSTLHESLQHIFHHSMKTRHQTYNPVMTSYIVTVIHYPSSRATPYEATGRIDQVSASEAKILILISLQLPPPPPDDGHITENDNFSSS